MFGKDAKKFARKYAGQISNQVESLVGDALGKKQGTSKTGRFHIVYDFIVIMICAHAIYLFCGTV
jgi:hypothetical protein